jgi:hypothetical protein
MKIVTLQDLLDRTVDNNGCLEWTGAITKGGYGHLHLGDKFVYAHRLSFELSGGVLPEGYFACHSCDNKKCINPEHIWAGTNSENLKDAQAKGLMRISKHGSDSMYSKGCKCADCLAAHAKWHREYMWRRKNG